MPVPYRRAGGGFINSICLVLIEKYPPHIVCIKHRRIPHGPIDPHIIWVVLDTRDLYLKAVAAFRGLEIASDIEIASRHPAGGLH